MTHIYTATGGYDTLTGFAQLLLDAGIQAIITNSLMIYATSTQLPVLQQMIPLSGLQVEPYNSGAKKEQRKSSVVCKMRRSW